MRPDEGALVNGFWLGIASAACIAGIARPATAQTAPYESAGIEQRSGKGIACLVNGRLSPPSYSARDALRSGTPALAAAERDMLQKIMRYVHPSTLRIAFLGTARRMIVFDAVHGPCYGSAPGYFVLNGGCNEFYSPFDGDGSVPECVAAPRPWIPHDQGDPHAPPWTAYPNGH